MKFFIFCFLVAAVSSFLTKTEPTEHCCIACTVVGEEKYYSIDNSHGMCGECCMNPSLYNVYKVFEWGLAKDEKDSATPCADRNYTRYMYSPTHGVWPI